MSHTDTPTIARPHAPHRVPKLRTQTRLKTLRHLDGRTTAAKRATKLAKALGDMLGGNLPVEKQFLIETAAVLSGIAADAQARRLAGEPIALDEVIRASRCARLALKDLGLLDGDAE